jgi:hypothetical protein
MDRILGLQRMESRFNNSVDFFDSTSSGTGCTCSTTSGSCDIGKDVGSGFF